MQFRCQSTVTARFIQAEN